MHITIFGATGKSGKVILETALARGDQVTAFVRTPAKLGELQSKLKVVQGDVADIARVNEAIAGADAVVSAIGYVSGSKPHFQTEAVRNIVSAMQAAGVSRLIDLTGNGVRFPGDHPGLLDKLPNMMMNLVAGPRMQDGTDHVEVIKASNLDWTIVRTPLQTDSGSAKYQTGMVGDHNLSMRSPRPAIASFIIDALEQNSHIHQAPVVTG